MSKKKAISYSLWGNNPTYIKGAIQNAKYIREHLPEWEMVLWYDSDILINQEDVLENLRSLGVKCFFRPGRIMGSDISEYGTFWRFRTHDLQKYDYVIFRDCDSRLSAREMAAVDEWIASGKKIHVIRDHPYHAQTYPHKAPGILGGLWGIKRDAGIDFNTIIANYYKARNFKESGYGSDGELLMPLLGYFKESVMIHDEVCGTGLPFPLPRVGYEFCGERIDQHGMHNPHDREILRKYLNRKDGSNA